MVILMHILIVDYIKLNLILLLKALIELRRIEAAEDIATQLAVSPNVAYLTEGSNMLLNAGGFGK